MKRLGGWDAVLLYNETPNLHQHTLKIAVVDASNSEDFSFDRFRQTLARRLHLMEPLRYKLVDIPAGLWGRMRGAVGWSHAPYRFATVRLRPVAHCR